MSLLFAVVRFVLLAAQSAIVAWWAVMLVACLGDCYGLVEALVASALSAVTAVVVFVMLLAHYIEHRKARKEQLERQARVQWSWLIASTFMTLLLVT